MAQRKIDKVLYNGDGDGLFTGTLGLMGTWEVAQYLGVEKSRIARWLGELADGKESIAPPVARLKSGPFWRAEQVQKKARQMYRAEHGRAPKAAELEEWLASRRARRAARTPADVAVV